MSTESVKKVLTEFICSPDRDALAIKGDWGVGKTYMWEDLLEKNWSKKSLKKYAYASLFGLTSIKELRSIIYSQTLSDHGEDTSNTNFFKRLKGRFAQKLPAGKEILEASPYGKMISASLDLLALNGISETLVCLDDFERLDSRIRAEEVLGLISHLKTEKECKVALIFNEDKLDKEKRDLYREFKEKVIDLEVIYAPTVTEAGVLAVPDDTPRATQLREASAKLGITNIRILRRLVRLANLVYPEISQLHERTQHQIFQTLALLTWFQYGPDESRIPYGFLRSWNQINWSVVQHFGKKEPDTNESRWAQQLEAYGFAHMDDLDIAVGKFVECGYLEESGLIEAAMLHSAEAATGDRRKKFDDAWNVYHDSLDTDAEKLAEQWISALKAGPEHISAGNLSSTITCLRELGYAAEASELIDFYIQARANTPKVFDLHRDPFWAEIKDEEVIKKFAEAWEKHVRKLSLSEAATKVAEGHGWDDEVIETFHAATPDELSKLLRDLHGSSLREVIQWLLRIGANGKVEEQAITQNARQALQHLASESKLNAMRLARYGIKPNGPN